MNFLIDVHIIRIDIHPLPSAKRTERSTRIHIHSLIYIYNAITNWLDVYELQGVEIARRSYYGLIVHA